MRAILCVLVLAVPGFVGAADDTGKTHEFERSKLPDVVKAKAGDTIVVIENVKPDDVESIKAKSNNDDIKIKTETVKGKVRIVITTSKKGKATVDWHYETASGRIGGHKGLDIEVE
jgi:hypothetical protein